MQPVQKVLDSLTSSQKTILILSSDFLRHEVGSICTRFHHSSQAGIDSRLADGCWWHRDWRHNRATRPFQVLIFMSQSTVTFISGWWGIDLGFLKGLRRSRGHREVACTPSKSTRARGPHNSIVTSLPLRTIHACIGHVSSLFWFHLHTCSCSRCCLQEDPRFRDS